MNSQPTLQYHNVNIQKNGCKKVPMKFQKNIIYLKLAINLITFIEFLFNECTLEDKIFLLLHQNGYE